MNVSPSLKSFEAYVLIITMCDLSIIFLDDDDDDDGDGDDDDDDCILKMQIQINDEEETKDPKSKKSIDGLHWLIEVNSFSIITSEL